MIFNLDFYPAEDVIEDHETGHKATVIIDFGNRLCLTVEIFTHHGGMGADPFTRLDTVIASHKFTSRLPRAYHRRWMRRLAREFAFEAKNAASYEELL